MNSTVDSRGGFSSWLTIGAFDGVHLGHQRILSLVTEGASKTGQAANVVTFFPHPAVFLRKIDNAYYLCTPAEQDQLLKYFGADKIITFKFDQSFSRLSTRDFVQQLIKETKFAKLLIGYDFRMGADRKGDHAALRELGEEFGFEVTVVDPVLFDKKPISSSRIREALTNGLLTQANKMLGYPYSISGEVVHGDGRGRHIGLPTANISPWPMKLLPATGVYAAFVEFDKVEYQSVVSIGYRPTFYESESLKTIESHILGFSGQIYGKNLRIHFIKRLREEEKYNSVETLMQQIKCDMINAEEILSNATKSPRLFT